MNATTSIKMTRQDAQALLRELDAFGDDCSDACKILREQLRKELRSGAMSVTIKAKGQAAVELMGAGIAYVLS